MTLIGLGIGATFSTIYDIAIGDIDPAEAGSASGSLSSVQQLANAIGAAVITTIYLGASRRRGARHDPQPAHSHRHRRAELPSHSAAAAHAQPAGPH